MNVTNATVLFRSDTAANFTSANTTLGNATYNAPELAYERDTKRAKLGVGNWTTIPYLPNASQITNLEADVANRSLTTHTHNATTGLTSGTVPTARLGGGTANSTTFLRGDQTWATVSGGGGMDRGFFYDIRDYGAALGAASAANNTAAVQAAVDAASVQSGGWGGGTVYFPATEIQNTSVWDLDSPVWIHGSNIKIQGEGSQNTLVRARGPAFVVSKHPRFWSVQKTTYASDGSATTGTVDGATNWINVSKCKPDLYEFRSSGAFPPTNGNPEFAPATITGTGQYFGIRTQLGVAQARFPYCPMITGDQAQSNQSADLWPLHSKLTWEFVHYNHQSDVGGGIAGGGSVAGPGAGPDPWILYIAGAPSDPQYYFELALTDKDMIDRTWVRFTFPANNTVGIHRVCIQFDPDNADSSKRLVAYVDGVQKTVVSTNIQWYFRGNYCYLNDVSGSGGTLNLWTKYNRVARWVESEFHVCGENLKSGFYSSDQAAYLKDYTVLAVAVHSELLYQVNGTGTSQLKLSDGTAADDSYVWAHTPGNFDSSNKTTLGWMANEFSWSANANTNTNINAMCRGQGGKEIWGYMAPKGDGGEPNWGGATAINAPAIEGLRIRQYNAYSVSCGILNGPWINCYRLNDLEFDQGYFFSIGSQWRQVSYYGRWSNLKLGKGVHLVHMTTYGDKWDWGYANVCAIRLSGCEFHLRDFSYPAPEANDEGFLQSFSGGSLGAGIYLYEGTINQEGLQFAPMIAVFYVQKNYAHGNNGLTLRDVQIGEVNAPVFYFDDLWYDDSRGTHIDIARSGFGAYGPAVIAKGKDWAGTVEVGPATYLTDQVTSISAISGLVFCDVKTIDKTSYGLPPTGGFTKDCHEIHVKNPAGGSPAIWRVTSTGKEGSANVPIWSAIETADSPTPSAISANIYPGIRANCVLPWMNGTNTTTLDFTSFTNQFANSTLATVLTNATAPNRTFSRLKWGYLNAYTLTDSAYGAWTGTEWEGTFFAGSAITNSGSWSAAANASKATNVTYNTTGRDPDGTPGANWTVYGQYKWVWAMEVGDGSDSMKAALVGRTNVQNPSAWTVTNASTPQVASGGLVLTRVNRPGTWTNYTSNQILDYMVGGTISLGTTWHFGLSKTTVNTLDGTGITEPSGGSYARIAVTRNSTNWGELFDAQYIYANKVAIEFAAPTGDWGYITDWFISDAASGGNIIAAGKLNRPIRVLNGDPRPTFLPGAFQVQL